MSKMFRSLRGCFLFSLIAIGLPLDWFVTILLAGRRRDQPAHSRLLHRWARRTAAVAGCRVRTQGPFPRQGLCVSNHVSYLDIPAYGSVGPAVFVSKHDVLYWPVFGQLAAMCGTLFIQRERKGHVADVGAQMETVLRTGVPLVVFPEGTSSNGEQVLPFKSSLFQPAIEHQWPVTPMWIGYELEDGSVADEIAYWGDMTLVPHLWNLFTKRTLRAVAVFGEPLAPGSDRKDLCRRAHAAVAALAARRAR